MQVLLVSAKDGLMARLQLQGQATKAETDDFNLMAFGRISRVRHLSIRQPARKQRSWLTLRELHNLKGCCMHMSYAPEAAALMQCLSASRHACWLPCQQQP